MIIRLKDNPNGQLSGQSVSTHSKVFATEAEKRFKTPYSSVHLAVIVIKMFAPYKVTYGNTEKRFRLPYVYGYIYKPSVRKFKSTYLNVSPTFKRYLLKAPYKITSVSRIETFKMYSVPYAIFGKNKKVTKTFKAPYDNSPGANISIRRTYKSHYLYAKSRDLVYEFMAPYNSTHVMPGNIKTFKAPYINIAASYMMEYIEKTYDNVGMPIYKKIVNSPIYEVDVANKFAKVTIPINLDKVITSKDGFRIFVTMPPLFLNYCINVQAKDWATSAIDHTDNSGIKIIKDATSNAANLIIDNIALTRSISSLQEDEIKKRIPGISLALYDYYYDKAINKITIVDGEISVEHETDDSFSNFGNLYIRARDVRDDTINYGFAHMVAADSRLFQVRIKDNGQCCFDRDIDIDTSSYTCRLPKSIVKYDIFSNIEYTHTELGNGGGTDPGGGGDGEDIPDIDWGIDCNTCGLPPAIPHYITTDDIRVHHLLERDWTDKIRQAPENQIFVNNDGERYVQILIINLDVSYSCHHKYTIDRGVVEYMYNPNLYDYVVKIAEYFKEDNKKDENLIVDNVDYNIEIDIPISDERFVSKMFENIKEYSVITAYKDNWRPTQNGPQ